jgi:hypothetical protein
MLWIILKNFIHIYFLTKIIEEKGLVTLKEMKKLNISALPGKIYDKMRTFDSNYRPAFHFSKIVLVENLVLVP